MVPEVDHERIEETRKKAWIEGGHHLNPSPALLDSCARNGLADSTSSQGRGKVLVRPDGHPNSGPDGCLWKRVYLADCESLGESRDFNDIT